MFDEICSELRDMIHDAIHDLVEENDFDELAPEFRGALKKAVGKDYFRAYDLNMSYTDDGLAIVCGKDVYSISIQKV